MTNYKLWLLVAQNANEGLDIRDRSELWIAEDTNVVPLGLLRLLCEYPGEAVHADYERLRAIISSDLANEFFYPVDRGIKILRQPGFSSCLIESTVQWDVGSIGGRRHAIRFVREAIDVG